MSKFSPTSGIFLTGVVVTAGRWANNQPITFRVVTGGTIIAIGLTALSEANEKLAKGFTALIVVTALLTYGPAIFKKLGLGQQPATPPSSGGHW